MNKYYIISFGCQMNISDSERIASILEKKGYKKASTKKEADLIIINMCSIRQSAVDRVYGQLQKLKEKEVIITGCVLKKDKIKLKKQAQIINIKDIANWREKRTDCKYLDIEPIYNTFPIALVPISIGCNNFCTYCCVPYTRGKETARPYSKIIKQVKELVTKNFKEIWLLGENVNSYHYKDKTFIELLEAINKIEGDFWIRFTSPNPKDFSNQLITKIASLKKITPYINLPLQSGDDNILKRMNRQYTVKQYVKIIDKLRDKIKDIAISTDIIVGFPGETKKQFQNTKKIFKEVKFDMAYTAKYSKRPQTASYSMKDNVSNTEKTKREKELQAILKKTALEQNKKFLNKTIKVLVTKEHNGFLTGKSLHYKTVIFKGNKDLMGKFCFVKITKISSFGLKGALQKPKMIVILGPTASGKTDLSIELAKRFKGEIISADSRQVYKKMNIGTGKITKKEMQGIPHYMLDIVSPKETFSVVCYQKMAKEIIKKVKGIPFLVGGSPFYIYSLTEGLKLPEIKPNNKLRKSLEQKTAKELFEILEKLDKQRSRTIEKENKRRLIRAIEIATTLGNVPKLSKNPEYHCLFLGIKKERKELNKLIKKRLLKRIQNGMIKEVKDLKKYGISYKKLDSFGLEYRWIAKYLQNTITKQEMLERLEADIKKFAKRQMTWFGKDKRINWIQNKKEAIKLIENFLRE